MKRVLGYAIIMIDVKKLKGMQVMKRREAREKAVQVLFQMTVGQMEIHDAFENIIEDDNAIDSFLEQLVKGTYEHLEEIDAMIKEALVKWNFDRIGNIDKTIMRLAVYEIRYLDDVPENVSLNEAVELSKIYGDDDTRKFVNGVLSRIVHDHKL